MGAAEHEANRGIEHWRSWRVLIGMIAVLAFTAAAVTMLSARADTSRRAQVLVAEVREAVVGVRYQPTFHLYGQPLTPEAAAEQAELRQLLADKILALDELSRRREVEAVHRTVDVMTEHVERMVLAMEGGDMATASAINDGLLTGAFMIVQDQLVAADRALQHSAETARAQAVAGIIVAVVAAGTANAIVLFRHQRGRERERELVASRAAVETSEARYRALLENSTDMILVVGDDLLITEATPAVKTVLGYEPSELIGTLVVDLMHPDDVPTADEKSTGEGLVNVRARHKDGTWLVLEAAYRDRRDEPLVGGTVVNARDVTIRTHLEDDLRRSQRLESVGQLAAGIAHEINTPVQFVGDNMRFLTSAFEELQGMVDSYGALVAEVQAGTAIETALAAFETTTAAVDPAFLREEVPMAVSQSLEGIDQVARIVRAMKAFGHPNGEEMAPANLNEALQNTIVVARNEYKYVADVQTHLGQVPLLPCHIGELNQVFLNLIVNAAHAIADTERPAGRKGSIVIASSVQGDSVVVAVADNGCGIPEELRDRIFEPFFTTKEVGRGTGQGLALAYSIVVDRHGGKLTVDSTVGEGTIFRMTLPLAPPTTAQVRAEEAVPA